ncbi:MAG: glycoside hydrolase family 18 protein [Treponema sp.]
MSPHGKKQCILLAYLDSGREWKPEDVCAYPLTHICYAFARIEDGEVTAKHFKRLERLQKIRELRPDIRILLSIGGWTADGFSDAALTAESRALFVSTTKQVLQEYGFEGVDMDWEYPGSDQAGIKARKEDKQNFTFLMQELRTMLDGLPLPNGKRALLTTALGAGQRRIDEIEVDKVIPLFDFINVMTYDMTTSSRRTRHHTNLYSPSYDPQQISLAKETELLKQAGFPSEKIVLGGAFYGRVWNNVHNEGTGLFADSEQEVANFEDYRFLAAGQLKDPSFKQYWDDSACAPYLFNGSTFISYDNERSMKEKIEFAVKEKLGGFMFWEFSLDDTHTLIRALSEAVRNNYPPQG